MLLPVGTAAKVFVEQLREQLVQAAAVARRAEIDAREAARSVATESEKKEDGRVALEFGSLATGQQQRARDTQQAVQSLDAMLARGLPEFTATSAIALGAIVDVATEDASGMLAELLEIVDALPAVEAADVEARLKALAERLGWTTKEFFMPVRVAMTGRTATPPLHETMAVMGKERCRRRIRAAMAALKAQHA